jgi:transposase-like protein
LVRDQSPHLPSEWAAISAIAPKLGCAKEAVHWWVLLAERSAADRATAVRGDQDRLDALKRKDRELKRMNDRLHRAGTFSQRITRGRLLV